MSNGGPEEWCRGFHWWPLGRCWLYDIIRLVGSTKRMQNTHECSVLLFAQSEPPASMCRQRHTSPHLGPYRGLAGVDRVLHGEPGQCLAGSLRPDVPDWRQSRPATGSQGQGCFLFFRMCPKKGTSRIAWPDSVLCFGCVVFSSPFKIARSSTLHSLPHDSPPRPVEVPLAGLRLPLPGAFFDS